MARSVRRPTPPTKPLLKAPVRIRHLDTPAVIGQLRQLHEQAADENVDRMPADEELFGALLYLEAHAGALKSVEARRASAIERVRLWEYLRQQTEVHQSRAVEDARAARAEWAELASALAVNVPSAAYNKALRLRAAALTNPADPSLPVRRTPEAVLLAERQAAAQAAATRRAEEEASRRHALMAPVARRLLEHRAALDDDDNVTFWLDQIEAVLPHCETPTQFVSLRIYVEAVVRELRKTGLTTSPSEAGEDAIAAIAAAAELVGGS
ncbi:hypothetical protein [Streptomyces sp. V4I2]|uniref:hypothetical protein n=1 Tax=Streptomyces sp. V4I2 TaxID=3042280 RepID=UPI0027879ED2|nr:hypothetical protein [Streptomyces sp. V4I2]MDQ1051896.1 hypothetical protein [Streptomyces sp. V4I2]